MGEHFEWWENNPENTTQRALNVRVSNWKDIEEKQPYISKELDRLFDNISRMGHCKSVGGGVYPIATSFTPRQIVDVIVESGLMTEDEAKRSINFIPNVSDNLQGHRFPDNFGSEESAIRKTGVVDDYGTHHSTKIQLDKDFLVAGSGKPMFALDLRGIQNTLAEEIVGAERKNKFANYLKKHSIEYTPPGVVIGSGVRAQPNDPDLGPTVG